MSLTFDESFDRLMGHEGGYVNHPDDPGGETMWGITKRVALANGYSGAMRELPRDVAKKIARAAYWDRAGCGQYHEAIAYQVMDAAYNHGIETAIRFLQRAVGVADDGVVGPHTLAVIQQRSIAEILTLFNAERLDFYTRLSSWLVFGKGWARRIVGNLRYLAEDAS